MKHQEVVKPFSWTGLPPVRSYPDRRARLGALAPLRNFVSTVESAKSSGAPWEKTIVVSPLLEGKPKPRRIAPASKCEHVDLRESHRPFNMGMAVYAKIELWSLRYLKALEA